MTVTGKSSAVAKQREFSVGVRKHERCVKYLPELCTELTVGCTVYAR